MESLSEVSQEDKDGRGLIYTCYQVSAELNKYDAEMAFVNVTWPRVE